MRFEQEINQGPVVSSNRQESFFKPKECVVFYAQRETPCILLNGHHHNITKYGYDDQHFLIKILFTFLLKLNRARILFLHNHTRALINCNSVIFILVKVRTCFASFLIDSFVKMPFFRSLYTILL